MSTHVKGNYCAIEEINNKNSFNTKILKIRKLNFHPVSSAKISNYIEMKVKFTFRPRKKKKK